jgi:hypothetical protein
MAEDETLDRLNSQLESLRVVALAQVDSVVANTRAVGENTQVQGTRIGGRVADVAGGFFSNLLKGTAISPLISGIRGLFGDDDSGSIPEPLPTYTPPKPQHVEAAISRMSREQIQGVDFGTANAPRVSSNATPQVQINVQAMDSRSFLDHSDAIARAVRDAMLNAHALNDIVSDI